MRSTLIGLALSGLAFAIPSNVQRDALDDHDSTIKSVYPGHPCIQDHPLTKYCEEQRARANAALSVGEVQRARAKAALSVGEELAHGVSKAMEAYTSEYTKPFLQRTNSTDPHSPMSKRGLADEAAPCLAHRSNTTTDDSDDDETEELQNVLKEISSMLSGTSDQQSGASNMTSPVPSITCLKPSRGTLLVVRAGTPDLDDDEDGEDPQYVFAVRTPWLVTYPAVLQKALRAANFVTLPSTLVGKNGLCRSWSKYGSVFEKGVFRAHVLVTDLNDNTDEASIGDWTQLIMDRMAIEQVLESVIPGVEIALIVVGSVVAAVLVIVAAVYSGMTLRSRRGKTDYMEWRRKRRTGMTCELEQAANDRGD